MTISRSGQASAADGHLVVLNVQPPSRDVTPVSTTGADNELRSQLRHHLPRSGSVAAASAIRFQDGATMDAVRSLDIQYQAVKTQLMRYQSFTTGLFPRYSTDKEVGYVRDSLYCAMACWALSRAYQRLDDDRGRIYELGQTAVKTMRGILMSWMRQADKMEKFKHNPCPDNALHSKFNLNTGEPTATCEEYGHLQLDVVSLYLVTLCQFIASGLQCIFSQDEVCFIQNLVFYIERSYRTPDYGMWELGTRYNEGEPELHASSLGMVKAALESINGFNLFGSEGSMGSVIYVDIDAHNRNRTTFETLLPRESSSKNTDASLLATIGFPCFATHNEVNLKKTMGKIQRRLQGRYGYRRFLRDGVGTVLHEPKRRFYAPGETKYFANVECQWPMFYAYEVINSVFDGDETKAAKFNQSLEPLLLSSINGPVIPRYYYFTSERLEEENKKPGTQSMLPEHDKHLDRDTGVFLWGQSLYIISALLSNKLVYVSEIDPIHRHLPASQRPKANLRHAVFQGTTSDPVVQIALIAESPRLQALLLTYGIQTQTPHQVEPVHIWSSYDMVKVFENLGKCPALKLSGRPARPLGSLSTSKVYRAYGETVLCYPLLFEISDFYLAADPSVIIDDIKTMISSTSKKWKLIGRPTILFLLREQNTAHTKFREVLDLLLMVRKGVLDGVRVRLARAQNLLAAACVEYLDFATDVDDEIRSNIKPYQDVITKSSYSSLVDIQHDICIISNDEDFDPEPHKNKPTPELMLMVRTAPETAFATKAKLLALIKSREGWDALVDDDVTVRKKMEEVLHQSSVAKNWYIARLCAAYLGKTVDSLAPSVTSLLVRGKHLTVGVFGHPEEVVDKPVTPKEIEGMIFSACMPYDIPAAVVTQELILALSQYISSQPEMFTGKLKIRIGWLIHAMGLFLNYGRSGKAFELYSLSPMEMKELLLEVLSMGSRLNTLTPLQVREINGSLTLVPESFYDQVWRTLEKTPGGIVVAGETLPQQPTLSEMTEYELSFAFTVEDLLSHIADPKYRQVMVELFMVVATILHRNPELAFPGKLDLDKLIQDAFNMFAKERNLTNKQDMRPFYELPANEKNGTSAYLAKAVVHAILMESEEHSTREPKSKDNCIVS